MMQQLDCGLWKATLLVTHIVCITLLAIVHYSEARAYFNTQALHYASPSFDLKINHNFFLSFVQFDLFIMYCRYIWTRMFMEVGKPIFLSAPYRTI